MSSTQFHDLLIQAKAGRITRRRALSLGLLLGLSTAQIELLRSIAPAGAAPTSPWPAPAPSTAAAEPGTFVLLRDGGAPDIDPHSAYDNLASMLFFGLYEMLIQYKDESTDEYAPMLATAWETSEDGTSVTFTIAEGATFHDGTPCDAAAVKASFDRFLLMDTGPVNVIKRFIADPAQISVVDPLTVKFDLGQPQPLFLAAMASEYGPLIVNPTMVEANKTDDDPYAHEWFLTNASGTGPYTLVENSPTEVVIMQKYDAYHGGWDGPHFDRIIARIVPEVSTRRQLLESGDADATAMNLTPEIVDALRGNDQLQVITYPSTAVYYIIMNAVKLNATARRGFSYAFPYDDVVQSAYKGLIERSGPLASTVLGYDPNVFLYDTDMEQAKALIEEGGFPEGSVFEYVLSGGDGVESVIAQLFQANLAKIGYQLNLVELDRTTMVDLVYGEAPAEERPEFIGDWGWWPDYNDPWNQFSPLFTDKNKDGISNGGYWLNERFEELMAEAAEPTTPERLTEIMVEAQNILTEQDPPVIYYGQLLWYTVMQKTIKGFVPNSLYLNSFPFYRMYREEA